MQLLNDYQIKYQGLCRKYKLNPKEQHVFEPKNKDLSIKDGKQSVPK